MKKPKNTVLVPTLLTYTDPIANRVFVAGTFNDWNADATALAQVSPGNWQVKQPLSPGRHEYLFVVDGKWTPDPLALLSAPNPHGGVNSVVEA